MSEGLAELWPLDRSIIFLNHGSFGACPAEVLRHQAALRAEMEANPVRFLSRDLDRRLDVARAALGAFLGADPDDLAFVPNATSGVNAVVRSLAFEPGDELLTTDHAYNACRNALEFVAARWGVTVVVAAVPFPVASPDDVVAAVMSRVTARTRLALLDHVPSPTGLVLPVERLIPALAARDVEVVVDGAHAPGMVPLDLRSLGATYYSGNCHKWLCAPKGSAFLWVRRDRHPDVRPLTISHGANASAPGRSRFRLEFDWTGTQDPTAWLTVPRAIEYVGSLLPGGWPAVMARNRALALEARRLLGAAAGTAPACPDEMIGSLASVLLPDGRPDGIGWRRPDPIQPRLFEKWSMEVPVMSWPAPPAASSASPPSSTTGPSTTRGWRRRSPGSSPTSARADEQAQTAVSGGPA
ncbi:MAG TPA: aminotransferase class V-fold PLP-dependent enzyme [Candidatus Limnocylindrales bacterium]|nr:aminotransferase class V-fold PLP-dependent enzyme [Candidatus Limnocylindrales bacterium]